jgi:hypothetical protein
MPLIWWFASLINLQRIPKRVSFRVVKIGLRQKWHVLSACGVCASSSQLHQPWCCTEPVVPTPGHLSIAPVRDASHLPPLHVHRKKTQVPSSRLFATATSVASQSCRVPCRAYAPALPTMYIKQIIIQGFKRYVPPVAPLSMSSRN